MLKIGVRIINGNVKILSDLNKKSGCIIFFGVYYTWKITVIYKYAY